MVLKEGQSLLRGLFRWKFEWAGLRKCGLQGCVCVCVHVCVCAFVVGVSQQNSLVPGAPLRYFFFFPPSLVSFCKYVDNIY